jgi:hypothetical protein
MPNTKAPTGRIARLAVMVKAMAGIERPKSRAIAENSKNEDEEIEGIDSYSGPIAET